MVHPTGLSHSVSSSVSEREKTRIRQKRAPPPLSLSLSLSLSVRHKSLVACVTQAPDISSCLLLITGASIIALIRIGNILL